MNSLERQLRQKQSEIRDKKYRILVTLIRADRPRYWTFFCNNCGTKIADIQSYEVVSLDDFYDPQNTNNHAVGIPCKSYNHEERSSCPYVYYFHLQ